MADREDYKTEDNWIDAHRILDICQKGIITNKGRQAPEEPAQPSPHITPEMLRNTLGILEAQGMVLYGEGGAYIPTEKGWRLLMSIGSDVESIEAYGHMNISATDPSAIKIITGDAVDESVVCVKANKSCSSLNKDFKNSLKADKKIEITFDSDGVKDTVTAYGSPALSLASNTEIMIRKDDVIDDSTLAILADKAANGLNKKLIEKLRNPKTKVNITLEIKS